jgi:hypothetical protein
MEARTFLTLLRLELRPFSVEPVVSRYTDSAIAVYKIVSNMLPQ